MTQEEKAQAYDKAIEVIRKCETDKYGCVIGIKPSDIFREFQESEDEKIRKTLIEYFNVYPKDYYGELKKSHILAWLEKQGEQEEPQVYETENGEVITYSESKGYEVVGSKFKDGDWVVRGNITAQILDVQEQYYVGIDTNGNDFTSSRFLSDDKIHLWTIEDAKDDDILVDEDNNIGIYRGKVDDVDWHSYIYLGCDNYLRCGGYHIIKNTKPATKEQRDQLEKAIADSDFTFDFDKKELKKIEHDVQLTEFEEAVKDLMNDYKDAIGDNDATIEEVKEHAAYMLSLIHQNPAWSEEDNKIIEEIINDIECARGINYHAPKEGYEFRENWLKSIKDRVQPQPKQEWSEEDERIINSIIHDIRTSQHYDTHSIGEYDKKVFWLKSLKDKYLPQQKQEWSEEDKGTLERIIYFINSFVDKDLGEVVLNEEIFTDDAQQELKRYVDFLRNIENIKN